MGFTWWEKGDKKLGEAIPALVWRKSPPPTPHLVQDMVARTDELGVWQLGEGCTLKNLEPWR